MTVQLSVAARDAMNDAIETIGGTAPYMRIYNGSVPANCAASIGAATLIAEGILPSDWANASSSGVKTKNGTWTVTGVSGAGAGMDGQFYRMYKADGTTCFEQGTVSDTGTPDLSLDNANIANLQVVTVSTFSKTAPNA